MENNKILKKLCSYFGVTLFLFAFILGSVFLVMFRSYSLNIHKQEMITRANSIADTLSGFYPMQKGNRGMSGMGAYFRFIEDIAGADVWIVDEQLSLVTMGKGMGHGNYNYTELPADTQDIIQQVFAQNTVLSQEFSSLFSQATLTVGMPIQDEHGYVSAVLLLHSPIHGVDLAVQQGFFILIISIVTALIMALALSLWLSKRFTNPIFAKEAMAIIQTEKIRQDFIANVSHELKTPVTVLRGSLEALCDKVVTTPDKVEIYYHQMLLEAKYLERLVGDLLDLSKLQNAEFTMEKTEISILSVLEDAIRTAQHLAQDKQITVKLICQSEDILFWGDYGRMRQMFLIILHNGIKFSPQNSEVRVEIVSNKIIITDSGVGIPPEETQHIFERFYKSRCETNKSGTGLGLPIAKQIAIRHNIELTVLSGQDTGACFQFLLPQKALQN